MHGNGCVVCEFGRESFGDLVCGKHPVGGGEYVGELDRNDIGTLSDVLDPLAVDEDPFLAIWSGCDGAILGEWF